jgi:uncharacterized protein (DUF433 family)
LRPSDFHQFITSEPGLRNGRLCVRGLRISVGDVPGWLAAGQATEQVVAGYPEPTPVDNRACLADAAARESHEVRRVAAG